MVMGNILFFGFYDKKSSDSYAFETDIGRLTQYGFGLAPVYADGKEGQRKKD